MLDKPMNIQHSFYFGFQNNKWKETLYNAPQKPSHNEIDERYPLDATIYLLL